MKNTIQVNNVSNKVLEMLVDDFENKYSFDTSYFVDFIFYGVKEKILGMKPMKYIIVLSNANKIILTDDNELYEDMYKKNFKEYMEN